MPETKRPLKVFLCHASQDKPAVRELSQRLYAEGWIDPWLDEKKLLPGQDWRLKIEEAVETSDIVIICLSNNSVSKEGFVQKELRYAREIALEKLEESIFLIPLRLDDCTVPRGLRFYQWVDYFGEKKDEAYTALVESLKLRYEQKLILEEHELIQKEKVKQEIAERIAREKAEHEAIEKATREKEEREKAQKAAREKLEREAAEKARREKAEREAVEKAAREKAKSDASEKAKRERAERLAAQVAALKAAFSKFISSFKLAVPKARLFFRIGGIIGIILILFWVGSWAMPKLSLLVPTAKASTTLHPSATIASSNSPVPFTKTVEPTTMPTRTRVPASTALPTEITDAKGVQMVLVPAGEFMMGSENGDSDEKPVHQVYLDDFYMDKYEVTNALYQACVEADGCTPPQLTTSSTRSSYYGNSQFDDYPVIYVDWNQAQTNCEWRGGGLPIEAQWEKAARDADGRTYPWGEGISCNQANYYDGSKDCVGDTTKVGSYESGKSPDEIYDLAGNVWEWVADWYDSSYYANSLSSNPLGPNSGQFRVMRGGGWDSSPGDYLRASDRSWYPRGFGDALGFRCARSVDESAATSKTPTPFSDLTPIVPANYTLQKGEYPNCIARRFNVNPDELLVLNGLTSGAIYYPNRTLNIPQTGNLFPPPRALRAHPTTYTVQSSVETVHGIACIFGDIDPSTIAQANGISVLAELNVGQMLVVP